jgi:hypothetical protein
MMRLRQRRVPHARAALGWTILLLAGVQVGLGLFLHHARPELRDPEFGSLLKSLRERLAEAPGRPLVLVLGSSRTANLFRPGALPATDGPRPVVFNFATLATGPLRQLQMFRRILDRGIRPTWVIVEMWPPYLTQHKYFCEEPYIRDRDLQAADASLLSRYFAEPWPAYQRLLEGQLAPVWHYRHLLLRHYAPFLFRDEVRAAGDWSDPELRVEGCGWLPAPAPRLAGPLFDHLVRETAEETRKFLGEFAISDTADAALRELLQTCKRHGIQAALVLVPEHGALRACACPEVDGQVAAYLGGLSRAFGVPVIDVRDWVPDDDFIDMTHALPRAAGPYTERFGREVLRPLLAGRPLDRGIMYPRPATTESPSVSRPGASH